jgi:UrcA family protein
MNTHLKTRIPFAVATAMLLTCLWGAPGAFADDEVRSERVKFHDLNVATPEGIQALYGRIHNAAKRVCLEPDPLRQRIELTCAAKAEREAIEKLNLAQLTAYYQWKTKTGNQTQPFVAAR